MTETAASRAEDLSVGFGGVEVTPPIGVAMAGFAARVERAGEPHDPFFARAMTARCTRSGERLALIAVDAVALDIADSARIRRDVAAGTGIPAEHVVVAATHTHGGPAVLPGRMGDEADHDALDRMVTGAVEAARLAEADRAPAAVRLTVGHADEAHNRRTPGGPTDRDVPAVWVRRADGLAGVLTSYACHPTVLSHENVRLTRDYPGEVVSWLEGRAPGATAMFVTGCAGDANTGYDPAPSAEPSAERSFAEAHRVGAAVGAAAWAGVVPGSSGAAYENQVAVARRSVPLPLSAPSSELAEQAAELRVAAASATDPGAARWLAIQADWAKRWAGAASPQALPHDVTALRLGDVVLVALPGEPFATTGLRIKEALGAGTVTFAYADGCPGYLPDRCAYDRGGYEVELAHRYYDQPAAFAPEAADLLVDAAIAVGREVRR